MGKGRGTFECIAFGDDLPAQPGRLDHLGPLPSARLQIVEIHQQSFATQFVDQAAVDHAEITRILALVGHWGNIGGLCDQLA